MISQRLIAKAPAAAPRSGCPGCLLAAGESFAGATAVAPRGLGRSCALVFGVPVLCLLATAYHPLGSLLLIPLLACLLRPRRLRRQIEAWLRAD